MSNDKLELLRLLNKKLIAKARNDFYTFVRLMAPEVLPEKFVDGKHIRIICQKLQEVEEGRCKRLMLFMPPGSMKSKIGSVLFPLWYMGRHPSHYILGVSHTVTLAEKFSGEHRDIIAYNERFKEIFPDCHLSKDKRAAGHWHTTARGERLAGGAGKAIAGFRGHVGIIDDAVSEQTAYSKPERERINAWYVPGFQSRMLAGRPVVVINTRWHLNDLSGHLLSLAENNDGSDKWEVISIPAIVDDQAAKLLGIEEGESFWPELWPLEELTKTKAIMVPAKWNALYMQTPTPDEGSIFQKEWFKEFTGSKPPKCEFVLMSMDTAFKDKQRSDYSAITVWGMFREQQVQSDGKEALVPQLVLLYSTKGRWQFPDLCVITQKLYDKWNPDCILIEDKASGQSLIQEMRRRNLPILEYKSKDNKEVRAHAITPHVQAGTIWYPPHKQWANEFLEEVCAFPYMEHDDYVDSFMMAVQYMRDSFAISHPDDYEDEDDMPHRAPKSYWNSLFTSP